MKWIQYFILSAGGILLAAALTRFLAAAGQAQVWALPDPVLGIPLRYGVLLVGTFELVVALICLFGKRIGLQVGLMAWLGVNYAVYRIGTIAMGGHHQATAIGAVTDRLHLIRGFTGMMAGFAPAYLLLGSGTSSVWLWLSNRSKNRQSRAEKITKMSCPSCGTHIRFDSANLGQSIPCRQCKATVILRKPDEKLKMACFFCHENIEFPAHALGEKLECPHCKMDITLKAPA